MHSVSLFVLIIQKNSIYDLAAHQCEVKPLFFELPAQAHPAPGHQLHLHHGRDHSADLDGVDQDDGLGEGDVADDFDDKDLYHNGDLDDEGDDLGEEDVDADHLLPHGSNHGHHQAGDHYKLLHCKLFLCHISNAILLQTLPIQPMLCHFSGKLSQMLFC